MAWSKYLPGIIWDRNIFSLNRNIASSFYLNNILGKFTDKLKFTLKKKFQINTVFRFNSKLNNIVKLQKDPLENDNNKGIVYQANCLMCNKNYVGQTQRLLSP